jgi:hypothetical protein
MPDCTCSALFVNLNYRYRPPILISVIFFFTASLFICFPQTATSQQSFSASIRHESAIFASDNHDFAFSRNIVNVGSNQRTQLWSGLLNLQLRQNLADSTRIAPALRLREAYIEYSASKFDIKVGRQMISWGRSEASFNSDFITPLDLSEFLTQDFTDIRLGITSVRLNYFFRSGNLEFIGIPYPEMSLLPTRESRWNLFQNENITITDTRTPESTLKNVQYAARWIGRPNLSTDVEIGVFSGFFPVPSLRKTIILNEIQQFQGLLASYSYTRSLAFLFSGQYRFNRDLALNAEVLYWQKRNFDLLPVEARTESFTQPSANLFEAASSGFLSENPFLNGMIGLNSVFLGNNLNLQYQFEKIIKYEEAILQDELFHSITVLVSRSAMDDLVLMRLLSRYNVNGNDIWLNFEISYDIADGLKLSSGGHIFNGITPDDFYGHLSFNQFRKNSFAFMKLTAWW